MHHHLVPSPIGRVCKHAATPMPATVRLLTSVLPQMQVVTVLVCQLLITICTLVRILCRVYGLQMLPQPVAKVKPGTALFATVPPILLVRYQMQPNEGFLFEALPAHLTHKLRRSSTVEEPDLFNDVEIMEVGDFPESDENYVSVELCSDDDEDDGVLLDGDNFASPKALLTDEFDCADRADGTSTYALDETVQNHRFLSDHEYLDDSNSRRDRTPVSSAAEIASDRMTVKVELSDERFSVPYVEDLGMQDLFNKDNAAEGMDSAECNSGIDQASGFLETKIEIEEPQIQEYIMPADECVGSELVSHYIADDYDSQDEVLHSLNYSQQTQQQEMQSGSRSPLENDHSYTTINIITPQPSDQDDDTSTDEDERNSIRKLQTLSNMLAREGNVSSAGGKKTVERMDKMIKSFLNRSNASNHSSSKGDEQQPSVEGSPSEECLSVQLSANCSERLENEDINPSTDGSVVTSNDIRREDFGSELDCPKDSNSATSLEEEPVELDELLELGTKFYAIYEQWLEKIHRHSEQIPKTRLDRSNETRTVARKVETAVQTERLKHSMLKHQEQRTLNEEYKKRLLDSSSDSSEGSSSSNSRSCKSKLSSRSALVKSSDSERDGDDMMQDFVRRNRRSRKGAKEKNNVTSSDDERASSKQQFGGRSKNRREQIYSDSSSDENEGKHSDDVVRAAEGDDNLLDGVLSGVDDIMSDVHDILPDAIGVVQDYLEGEEKRQEREERTEETSKRGKNGAGKESNNPVITKSKKDMTAEEREEYEDMQIERLCNISNIIGCRNASGGTSSSSGTTTTAVTKAKDCKTESSKKKKDDNDMDHFLNHENGSDTTVPIEPHSDESSESEKDVVETEEQFLQKCNENMKQQLLNQLSSSEITSEEDNLDNLSMEEDSSSAGGKQNGSGGDLSDESSGSLVESFLKRHDSKQQDREARKKQALQEAQVKSEQDNGDMPINNGQMDESADNETIVADSSMEMDTSKETKSEQPETLRKPARIELANPKDKELFSNDLFDDITSEKVNKTPRKRRKRMHARKGRGSDSDLDTSSDDSDVAMLDGTPKKRQRKRKASPTLESFDFSASLSAATASRTDKTTVSANAGGIKSERDSEIAKQSTTTGTTGSTLEKSSSSPAPEQDSTTTGAAATSTTGKQKGGKDGQDCISVSSDSSDDAELISGDPDEVKTVPEKEPKRRIRAMLSNDDLAEETKKAQKEEEGRTARLRKKMDQLKKFLATYKPGTGESELVLDYDSVRKQAICVHPEIVKLLKPHQIEGIKFMYDNTYGSVDALAKHSGSGCILAHCMGLGKTLQMISLLHTVMRYPQLMTNRVLVICPKSTVMNWKEEIIRWQGTIKTGYQMKVYCFPDVCTQSEKISVLKRWYYCKSPNCGVMLIGYEAFRSLINYERRKGSVGMSSAKLALIKEYLLNPGADLVICDEGHQIKNKRSAISEAVSKIKTRRRIMLTGTPIQNNLREYYCMVNFIKPSFLGSDKEFSNLYANPIKNGQCKDSDQQAIKIMKQRSYVLHNKLSKFVQRKEAAVLKEFLPEKFEYVLFVPLTPVQEKMYEVFLQMNDYTNNDVAGETGRTKKFKLIADYTSLRKIWTHPKVLEKAWESANMEKNRRDAARKTATPDSDDESPDDHNDITSGKLSVTNDWWRQYLQTADLESLYPSNKLWILFEILKFCNERGEKVLIFTAFVSVLNMVEHFMAKIHHQDENPQQSDAYAYSAFKGPWEPGKDYYRLDGKTPKSFRHKMITSFNDPQNTRTKCFLISAKAGGQGINLTGANRVIILDTSWNPSNDQQNIFRIFRLGQKRKCYVYRLIAAGTMEEKVYSRSVTKQALSFRVVDEQQIDRHYSYGELAELYNLTKVSEMTRETPILPADDILASLLRTYPNKILKYHEHDSLLENKPEQDLSEEEKKEAWAAYEREIQNNENRLYMSQYSAMGAAAASVGGLFGSSPYASSMAPFYHGMNYPGMAGLGAIGAGGDMYRNDYSYNRPLYMQYGASSQYSSLMNDPAYATALAKMYGSFSLPGTGAIDYGMSSLAGHSSPMGNGQSMLPPLGPASSNSPGGSSGKGSYNTSATIANMLSLLSGKSAASSSGLSPAALNSLSQSLLSNPSSSSLAELAAHHSVASSTNNPSAAHYNPLKQMSDYAAASSSLMASNVVPSAGSSGLAISSIASLHKSNPPTSAGKSGSVSSSFDASAKAFFNRLSEQMAASSLATAGVSSPFSPRNVPLLSPTLDSQSRSNSAGVGTFPITSSPIPSNSNGSSSTIANPNSSKGTTAAPSVQSTPSSGLRLSIGQNPSKSVEQPNIATNRVTVDNFAENRMPMPLTATNVRGTSKTSVNATPTTIIPSDDDDNPASKSTSSAKTPLLEKRDTGSSFSLPYNTKQSNNTNESPAQSNGSGKDALKTTKKALSNLAHQLPKPSSPKLSSKTNQSMPAVPAVPPIISNPLPSGMQLSRSNTSTSVGSGIYQTTAQQAIAKTAAMKPRGPSPTLKITAVTSAKQSTTVTNKASPLSRSPLTVQMPVVTNNKATGTLASPATAPATPTSMKYLSSAGAADQRTVGTAPNTTTAGAIGGMAVTAKSQGSTISGMSVAQMNSVVASAAGKNNRTISKQPTITVGINPLNVLAKQSSMNSVQTSGASRPSLLNSAITAVKQPPAVTTLPKPKPEGRPMTLTMTPIKTPVPAVTKAVTKSVTPTATTTIAPPVPKPKLGTLKLPTSSVSSTITTGRTLTTTTTTTAARPVAAVPKSGGGGTKITPVSLLSTAGMTGKLNNPMSTTPRLQAPNTTSMVKTSLGASLGTNTQPVLVSRSNSTTGMINRAPAVVNRAGKSPITITAVGTVPSTGITIAKATPSPAQRVGGPAGAITPAVSSMT
uniref:Transcriptional regulator ATRX n=1 Tax=Anopheles epiroticus TaxID=199890 RepID=A0A182P656_9DIPT